ncbi:hypothetical protein PGB90_001050 [Kerria lacca]
MVVFTCNNCGDSVKKPKVEKHISLECKKKKLANVSLCCVDCLENFNEHTYSAHTKCVTELERYSAKGFVAKASSNKGERKQNSWVNVVRLVLDKPTLTSMQRQLLKIISNFENVPRKKNKFQNFINNSCKHIRPNQAVVDSLFDLLEQEFKNVATPQNNQELNEKMFVCNESKKEENSENMGTLSNTNFSNDQKNGISSNSVNLVNDNEIAYNNKKKNKKNNKKDENYENKSNVVDVNTEIIDNKYTPENNSYLPATDNENSFQIISKKKKKKKHGNSENQEVIFDKENKNTEGQLLEDTISDEIINSKKIPKKKRKKIELQSESNIISFYDNNIIDDENDSITIKNDTLSEYSDEIIMNNEDSIENYNKNCKKKNKKFKCKTTLKTIGLENSESKTDEFSHKNGTKIKKKRKLSEGADVIECVDKKAKFSEIHEENGNEYESSTGAKFNWNFIVRSLLEKSNNGEMSLKKMIKKVVNEYQNCRADNKTHDEIVKKFNKKLVKLPFVTIFKERVRLNIL